MSVDNELFITSRMKSVLHSNLLLVFFALIGEISLKVTHLFRCERLSSNPMCISLLTGLWKFYRYFRPMRNNNYFERLAAQDKLLIVLSSWMFATVRTRKQTNITQTTSALAFYDKAK